MKSHLYRSLNETCAIDRASVPKAHAFGHADVAKLSKLALIEQQKSDALNLAANRHGQKDARLFQNVAAAAREMEDERRFADVCSIEFC